MFKSDLLEDKVILITGGGTGLGKEMGNKFTQLGAKLAITGRREEVLKNTADEMINKGAEVYYTTCDIRDPKQIKEMVDRVEEHYGKVDVLINNAAANFISPTERISPNGVDAILRTVLHGTFYATLEVGKRWIQQGRSGTMLNMATVYAEKGSAFVVPSAAAKAGIVALTRSLAVEWAKYGIRQVALAPGSFPTEGAWSRLAPTSDINERMLERIPVKRFGNPEELTNLAAYLISGNASFINGEVIIIDGGEWLQGAGVFNNLVDVPQEKWDEIEALTRKAK